MARIKVAMEQLDLTFVDQIVAEVGTGPEKVLEILQAIQGHYGYLAIEALRRTCELTEITPASIAGVSTFYDQFRHRPAGRHIIHVCVGTACHVKGSEPDLRGVPPVPANPGGRGHGCPEAVHGRADRVPRLLHAGPGRADRRGDLRPSDARDRPEGHEDFLRHEQARTAESKPRRLRARKAGLPRRDSHRPGLVLRQLAAAAGCTRLCRTPWPRSASRCRSSGSAAWACVTRRRCWRWCSRIGSSFLYARVQPEDAKAIVLRHFGVKGPHRKLSNAVSGALDRLLTDEESEPVTRYPIHVRDQAVSDFLGRQIHISTEHCGHIDPTDLDEYVHNDGFKALEKVLKELTPEAVIGQIEASGIRGRGGAGFPDAPEMVRRACGRRPPRSTSSATATRATPARSWTAC